MAARHTKLGGMNISKHDRFTFEQLCIRKEYGFSIDLNSMFIPSNPDSFDEVVFKLISKIDTSLLLLNTHGEDIISYTVIAIPLPYQDDTEEPHSKDRGRGRLNIQPPQSHALDCSVIQNAWDYLSTEGGWHCLQSLSLLQPDSIPDNGARKYSLYQYVTCIMDVIRANYMFEKHRNAFHHETLEMFDDEAIKGAKQAIFGLLWKRSSSPLKRKSDNLALKRKANITVPIISSLPKKKNDTPSRNVPKLSLHESRQHFETTDSEEEMDVDDEISFKKANLASEREDDDQMYGEESSNEAPAPASRGVRRRKQVIREDSSPPPLPHDLTPPSHRDVTPSFHDVSHLDVSHLTLGFETRPTRTPREELTPASKGRRRTLKRDPPPPSPPQEEPQSNRFRAPENGNVGRRKARRRQEEDEEEEEEEGRRAKRRQEEGRRAKRRQEEEEEEEEEEEKEVEEEHLQNVTLGFETSAIVAGASKAGRKSMGRKSLASDWPEPERESILQIFDNFNPKVSEQKKIALTCKYVALQLDKDLPSKLLYQWVQKKGRSAKRTIASFDIPEGEAQKQVALKFFRELKDSCSESARVAFSLKYLDAQYGFSLTSKQLYSWLNEKPAKKAGKKR